MLSTSHGVPEVLWTADLASISYGGGAVGELDGVTAIVFGTYFNDEHLYCLRAKDGKPLWKFKSEGGPFDASVALVDLDGDGRLEVLAADSSTGTLFCLDGAGKVQWKFKLPSSTDSPPAVADLDDDGHPEVVVGTMTTADGQGRVVAFDARTLKEKWQAKVPGHVQSEPVLTDLDGDGLPDVIVTSWRGDKSVRALSGKDGSLLWTHAMKGDMYHGVTIVSGDEPRIVAASIARDVTMLDRKGKVVWSKEPGGYLFGPGAAADLDGDGKPEIIIAGGRLHVYGLDGAERWRSDDYKSITRGVAVADADGDGKPDLLFGGGIGDHQFRALAGATGKVLWTFDAKVQGHVYENIDSGPVVGDFDGDGNLEVFFVCGKGTSDDTKAKNYGRAFALRLGKGKSGWPTFRGNLLRTGVAPT